MNRAVNALVTALRSVARVPVWILLGALWVYQRLISPVTPPTCRYYPSCSQYAVVALRRHGFVRGGWLAARRLARCHPWSPGGVDDVPPVRSDHRHLDAAHPAH
ncbi:membrane protein insertion efficiency factor YidD [Cellulomonas composti]|uniref:Putative membrane protein insertion efficiency factor n=1 Tax=Cellulomonas composti TaxID=266130 RepID=A0A511JEH1_9CELL|nr:membrane protein insertion efficiency factor YidD [Cellulomonas composti]GEL96133.1 hypothetical protein CCO02nite_27910 [Cellulomonas composti]